MKNLYITYDKWENYPLILAMLNLNYQRIKREIFDSWLQLKRKKVISDNSSSFLYLLSVQNGRIRGKILFHRVSVSRRSSSCEKTPKRYLKRDASNERGRGSLEEKKIPERKTDVRNAKIPKTGASRRSNARVLCYMEKCLKRTRTGVRRNKSRDEQEILTQRIASLVTRLLGSCMALSPNETVYLE